MGKRKPDLFINCLNCNKEFKISLSAARRKKFCSKECMIEYQAGKIVKCGFCGKEKYVQKYRLNKSTTGIFFCNPQCRSSWVSKNLFGENSPIYKSTIIKCSYCGKEKLVRPNEIKKYKNHFCNPECKGKWMTETYSGNNAPNWNGGGITVECTWCGKEKEVEKWHYERNNEEEGYLGRFVCSRECEGKIKAIEMSGECSPRWTERLNLNCSICNKDIKVTQFRYNQSKRKEFTCSSECLSKWMSLTLRGENSPNWKGGITLDPYGYEFNDSLKLYIRERDDYNCQLCGVVENGKKHHCHHINYRKDDNRERNIISLCLNCHPRTNFNREYWQSYFENIMNLRYGSSEDVNED